MDRYFEVFAKVAERGIIRTNQNFRIYSRQQALNTNMNSKWGTVVYFLFLGDCLQYVGQTGALPYRIRSHSHNYRMKFDSVFVLWFDQFGIDYDYVSSVERRCIEIFKPKHNIQNNPDYKNINGKRVYLPELESILKTETQTH